jgi:hypothetical protein
MHLHPSQVSPCSIRIAATNAFCRLYTCTASFLHINALGELHSPVGTTKKNSPLEKRQLNVVLFNMKNSMLEWKKYWGAESIARIAPL